MDYDKILPFNVKDRKAWFIFDMLSNVIPERKVISITPYSYSTPVVGDTPLAYHSEAKTLFFGSFYSTYCLLWDFKNNLIGMQALVSKTEILFSKSYTGVGGYFTGYKINLDAAIELPVFTPPPPPPVVQLDTTVILRYFVRLNNNFKAVPLNLEIGNFLQWSINQVDWLAVNGEFEQVSPITNGVYYFRYIDGDGHVSPVLVVDSPYSNNGILSLVTLPGINPDSFKIKVNGVPKQFASIYYQLTTDGTTGNNAYGEIDNGIFFPLPDTIVPLTIRPVMYDAFGGDYLGILLHSELD